MAIVVSLADRDERDPRAHQAQEVAQAFVRRPVVGDFQELDLGRMQRQADGRLGIAREERVELPVAREEDNAVLVRILAGEAGAVRPENADPKRPEGVGASDTGGHDRHVLGGGLPLERSLVGTVRGLERVEHEADRERVDHGGRAADMVAMRMRDDHRREPPNSQPP